MKVSPSTNFITGLVSVLLCIIFVITSLAAVILGTLSSAVAPSGIADILTASGAVESVLITGDAVTGDEVDEKTREIIEEVRDSELAIEVIGTVSERVSDAIAGDLTGEIFTPDDLRALAEEHIDEIAGLAKKYSEEEITLTDEELKSEILKGVDEAASEISQGLPKAEELRAEVMSGLDSDIAHVVGMVLDGSLTRIATYIAAASLILIVLMRVFNLSGLTFAGVASAVAAVLSAVLTLGARLLTDEMRASAVPEALETVRSVTDVIMKQMTVRTAVLAAVAVVLIALRLYVKKQRGGKNEIPV